MNDELKDPGTNGSAPTVIVGVGASAGGLEALEELFRNMPVDSGMSFVVVQHLSPDFKSHMDELLGRITQIPVQVVRDGVKVAPDNIYLIPPKMEMVINQGRLLLTERSKEKMLTHPIDQFFRALAQDAGSRAVGIVLSGTGSDGSRGIADIRDTGGLVIAQDPSSCRFDAMPLNAQETGKVHLVLLPNGMGAALEQYAQTGKTPEDLQGQHLETLEKTGLDRIFQLLQRGHKIDFSHYKSGTVHRRIQRRIDLGHHHSLDGYIEALENNPVEVNELYMDLMIGVTRFFRDTEAFDVLEKSVIPELIEKSQVDPIRVWVCGCASGEEAYSLAMLFQEAIDRSGRDVDFKMFATDAHKPSLQVAATGIYAESKMSDVSPERRERFFNERNDGYSITSELRRRVVFAPHNVISDPPFTQMDLVTCRNMLIYLRPPAQQKTLSLFHFALKANGFLFLGPSESAGEIQDEFDPINTKWKVFRKRRDVRLPIEMRLSLSNGMGVTHVSTNAIANADSPKRNVDLLPAAYDVLLSELMPPSVLIDRQFNLLHAFDGSDLYLRVPTGRPSQNILEMIYPAVKNSIAAAVQHALKDEKPVRYSGLPHPTNPESQVRLIVRPIAIKTHAEVCVLLQFESVEEPIQVLDEASLSEVDMSAATSTRIDSLEQELSFSRQNLQATIEELETSNEELQATNEEMVAANEELQSTNEELHSVNEELYTVNAEHQKRVTELDEANADMNNLLASTRVGVIFLDRELYVRRFTPVIGRMLGIEPNDVGRNLDVFIDKVEDDRFMERLSEVLETQAEQEWELRSGGVAYFVRAMPYRTGDEIDGVVVSFVDISKLKRAESDVARFKIMADVNVDAQVLVDRDGRLVYANQAMARRLGYTVDDLMGTTVMRFDADHDAAAFQTRFNDAMKNDGEIFESTHQRKDGTCFPVEVAATHVELDNKSFLFCTIRDISARREAERERLLLEQAIGSIDNGILIADASRDDMPITYVNRGFLGMTGYEESEVLGSNCRFLQGDDTDPETVMQMREAIRESAPCRVTLRNYRKNGELFWNDLYLTPVRDHSGTVTHYVGVQSDVTERIEATQRAVENERTVRVLLDSTAEGIFGIDRKGVVTFSNPAAANLLGYESPEELHEIPMHECLQAVDSDGKPRDAATSMILSSMLTGKEVHARDDSFLRKDGTSFPIEVWAHPIRQDDECVGAVVTFFDDSDRQAGERELREARDSADAANVAKSRFLANMSHELRTPLAAILGFTKILEEEIEDADVAEKLSTIQRNGDYLLRLVGDVLDLSRIESGKFSTVLNSIDLDEFFSDIRDTMIMRTTEYQNELHFHFIGKVPRTITTDPARLRQVLINLLANALKFSPKGCVDVSTTLTAMTDDIPALQIEVKDTGIGIASEQMKQLFEPFTQADNTIVERFGGTGLGLSISNRLVEAMGGDIEVESQLGTGSRFVVTIPIEPMGDLVEIELADNANEKSVDAGQNKIPKTATVPALNAKVLIADDMRDVRFVAQHFLKKAGCEVELAENGRLAVDAVRQSIKSGAPYDFVLMDVQMPVLDGVGAVKELRKSGIEIPIVALTADAMKGTRRQLLTDGFDEYLTKPLNVDRLMLVVQSLLKHLR